MKSNRDVGVARMNTLKAIVRKRLIAMNRYSAELLVDLVAKRMFPVIDWQDLRITNDTDYLKTLDDVIRENLE